MARGGNTPDGYPLNDQRSDHPPAAVHGSIHEPRVGAQSSRGQRLNANACVPGELWDLDRIWHEGNQ
jgi:hypothetical protein